MGKQRGRDLAFFVSPEGTAPRKLGAYEDYTLVGLLTNRGLNQARGALDVTGSRTAAQVTAARSKDEMDYLSGRRALSLPIEAFYDAAGRDAGLNILRDSFEADATDRIYWLLAPDDLGGKIFFGRALVTALNTTGEDDAGATLSMDMAVDGGISTVIAPRIPRAIAVAARANGYDLTWAAPLALAGVTVTGYRVRHRLAAQGDPLDAAGNWIYKVKAAGDTSDRRTGLNTGKIYDVQMRTETEHSASAWSEIIQVTAD